MDANTQTRGEPLRADRTYEELRKDAPNPDEVEISVSVGAENCCGPSPDEYRRIVEKVAAHKQDRSSREAEIEHALGRSMPGVLREVLDESGGMKRPALRDLNARLDAVEKDRDVSHPTFYKWVRKYSITD